MYSEQMEQLISAALADGVLTEKEKNDGLEVVAKALKDNFEVITAESGAECVELVKKTKTALPYFIIS